MGTVTSQIKHPSKKESLLSAPMEKSKKTKQRVTPLSDIEPEDVLTSPNKYHISATIKSIDGDEVRDYPFTAIMNRCSDRPDHREADTPIMGKVHPKSSTPQFLIPPSWNPDSISTPHTFARVTNNSNSPKKSGVGNQLYHFLRKAWDVKTNTFSFRTGSPSDATSAFAAQILEICAQAESIFASESMFLRLPANVFVLGDVHGNYADFQYFMTELLLFHDIELTPYSFLSLGDYVDRGEHSVECVALSLALKCLSPSTFFMLRGNHEDPGINGDVATYGPDCFKQQAINLFGEEEGMEVWTAMNAVFQQLPLAACIDDKIFCSHGGIPRYFGTPEDDDRIKILESPDFPRFRSLFEPLDMTVLGKERMERFWVTAFDLMWSDPSDDDSEMNEYGFGRNDRGNCIITFSEVAVNNFLGSNGMELMFRAHQEKSDGLKLSKSAKCLTIFSTSNYQGHGNGAGVVYVGKNGTIRMIMKEAES